MQFLTRTQVDFMKYRPVAGALSILLVVASLVYVLFLGQLNIGIDFAGGTQLTLRFKESADLDQLRAVLTEAGFADARIQSYGEPGSNEVLIRTATVEGSEEGAAEVVLSALDARFNADAGDGIDLNRKGAEVLTQRLAAADPEGVGGEARELEAHYAPTADLILETRRSQGLISSVDEVTGVEGLSDQVRAFLTDNALVGNYSLLAVENVGPQIGGELKSKGIWAVILSLLGMLTYIAFRFELRFGIGAVVAILHDVTVTLGLYAFGGFEFNLTTIAAFLTLVGYSVNDTVVVFDRVRENMNRVRRSRLVDTFNESLNQTLARTVMTSVTTLLVVTPLFLFGGDVIHGFAFLLLIGILVGTYSSIFVASPVVLLWEKYVVQRKKS